MKQELNKIHSLTNHDMCMIEECTVIADREEFTHVMLLFPWHIDLVTSIREVIVVKFRITSLPDTTHALPYNAVLNE